MGYFRWNIVRKIYVWIYYNTLFYKSYNNVTIARFMHFLLQGERECKCEPRGYTCRWINFLQAAIDLVIIFYTAKLNTTCVIGQNNIYVYMCKYMCVYVYLKIHFVHYEHAKDHRGRPCNGSNVCTAKKITPLKHKKASYSLYIVQYILSFKIKCILTYIQ